MFVDGGNDGWMLEMTVVIDNGSFSVSVVVLVSSEGGGYSNK